ncbi:MAG TPA: SAM-dependent methyltransferase [Cytophagales bacterium]|nr:SAM-dependent methyltransferase [Cytophagales bacterium]
MNRIHFLPLLLLLAVACSSGKSDEHRETDGAHGSHGEAQPHGHHSDTEGHHGGANEYMHQASLEELIERFESPERDAYQKPEQVLEYLGDLTGKRVMDIGAGSGYFSVRLAAAGAQVIAADVDDDFQAYLKNRIEEQGIENISLRKLPYDSPALQEGEVDMVLMVNTYHHIQNRSAYFAQVKQSTADDGELVVIDFFKSDTPVGPPKEHKVSMDQVIDELKQAGYTSFAVEVNLLPYQFIIRAQ